MTIEALTSPSNREVWKPYHSLQKFNSQDLLLDRTVSVDEDVLLFDKVTESRDGNTPFLRLPNKDGLWLPREFEAPEWWNLFYDLAVVAVLTIFSTNHELNRPSAIPIFLSFYAVICWVWTSQVHYDIRYQASDGWHRLAKAIQIMTLVFMGAISGDWNPRLIRNDEAYLATKTYMRAADHRNASSSFTTVLVSFVISRAFLACQYAVSAGLGRRITLFYVAIGIEVASAFLTLPNDPLRSLRSEGMGNRYGASTLIVLGEGFISITRAFNYAISGFSITSMVTYPQVLLAICIMYLLFIFLFSRFQPSSTISADRALLWETRLDVVTGRYLDTIQTISNGTDTDLHEQHFVARYFDQLYLTPEFNAEMAILRNLSSQVTLDQDPVILAYQYFGQIMFQVTNGYGLEVEDSMIDNLAKLYAVDTTWYANETMRLTKQEETFRYLGEIIQEPASTSWSGILWLFPTAGAALVFCGLRSILWNRSQRVAHHIVRGIWVVLGILLACLGFLDIGSDRFNIFADTTQKEFSNSNSMYRLIDTRTPLVIVMLFYLTAYLLDITIMRTVNRPSLPAKSGLVDRLP
uniref:Uncharacterized protein n=1 Tax=Kwoniella dejecticola CBS 10117 TaxID=1296121 RepID=A0A1A6AEW7_9TREE|nr:uncharacterized protein I303_00418 [Kwoniella dejecticola CBS 10117]OBR88601.1 hypothetical protein I303_00418 [Kwoniella dejecticola CBS 10117]